MEIRDKITKLIEEALTSLGIPETSFVVEHPTDPKMGDYSTNVAIKFRDKKDDIFAYIEKNKPEEIEKVELAGPGFINFYLSKEFFKESLEEIVEKGDEFGKSEHAKGHKVMVEYTDPNPFKEFHIGHLMSNAIGEAVARIIESNGARVIRANWEGDVGIHVAKAIWGMKKNEVSLNANSSSDWGKAYALGAKAYEEDENAKKEIVEINKKVYEQSDPDINSAYVLGRTVSLDSFELMYQKLGTKFNYYFFEGKEGVKGKPIVEEYLEKGVFEKSEGAVIFPGEKYGLHTRVFINSQGLPTYEAKELGLNKEKFEVEPDLSQSVIVTGNEIKEYFKVLLKVMSLIFPKIAEKTKHLPHGMLRLPEGKMSSRTGNVITAESLIEEVKEKVKGQEDVAIAAIKYMILRQAIGNDIIFDFEKSVSTEGDSGVYLQYAHARANSILEKARDLRKTGSVQHSMSHRETHQVEKLLYRFPEMVERAGAEYAPNYIVTYLTELAAAFNNFYATEPVLEDSPESAYRLAIVEAFKTVMKNGLTILGIVAPERM